MLQENEQMVAYGWNTCPTDDSAKKVTSGLPAVRPTDRGIVCLSAGSLCLRRGEFFWYLFFFQNI